MDPVPLEESAAGVLDAVGRAGDVTAPDRHRRVAVDGARSPFLAWVGRPRSRAPAKRGVLDVEVRVRRPSVHDHPGVPALDDAVPHRQGAMTVEVDAALDVDAVQDEVVGVHLQEAGVHPARPARRGGRPVDDRERARISEKSYGSGRRPRFGNR